MEYAIIRTKNVTELRKSIDRAKDIIVVEGGDDKINRVALENKKVDILLSPEKGRGPDKTHYRNSGLNQVLCKLAAKNKIAIGFNFDDIIDSKDRSILMGRMMQNVRFCRKYKVRIVLDCFGKYKKDKKDLAIFAQTLGMTPGEAKQAVNFKKINEEIVKIIE